jgi:SAM-dependent methyltransferase
VYASVGSSELDVRAFYQDRYPAHAFLPQRERKEAKSHVELSLLEGLTDDRRLLDVGCSYGFFLDSARQRGWTVTGVEPAATPAAHAKGEYGLDVHVGLLEDAGLQAASYDVVTIRHVLEHVPDPLDTLLQAHRLSASNGLLLVAVPNFGSLPARWLGRDWWWIDPPTHLTYFEQYTLANMLERAGFTPLHWETARGDDERFLFYLLFATNRRLGLVRRLRGFTRDDSPTGEKSGPIARGNRWARVRSLVDAVAPLGRPLGAFLDSRGLGSELLVVARRRPDLRASPR